MSIPGWNGMDPNSYTQFLDTNLATSTEFWPGNESRPLTFSHGPATTLNGISPSLGSTAGQSNLIPTDAGLGWSQTQLDGRNYISENSFTSSESYPDPAPFFSTEAVNIGSQPSQQQFNWSQTSTPANFSYFDPSTIAKNVSLSSDTSRSRTSTDKPLKAPSERALAAQKPSVPDIRFVPQNVGLSHVTSKSPVKKMRGGTYPQPVKTTKASPNNNNTSQLTENPVESRTVSPNRVYSPATPRIESPDGPLSARPLELALPLKHVTGAQNLLSWPAIRNLLPPKFAGWFTRGGPASGGILNQDYMPRSDVGYFLKRDFAAIDRAEWVFMERIFILHPLLDSKQLHESIQRFKSTLVNAVQKPSSKDHSTTRKRRREAEEEERTRPDSEMRPRVRRDRGFPAMNISRTLENAKVLLVIGLGLICGRATPGFEVESIVNPRRQTEGSFPGFSHYHLAAGILGDYCGAMGLEYIQAKILACLYVGQLTDVHGSHQHLTDAAWTCWNLLHSPAFTEERSVNRAMMETKETQKLKNLAIINFWSIIQLESDILAEVEFLPSGISRLEQSMESFPHAESMGLEGPEKDEIMQSYSDQIQLRRTLNEVHTSLYEMKPFRGCEAEQPNFAVMTALNDNLEDWRKRLESSRRGLKLKWDWTENHKSRDINEARTIGKYFGAKYIIHRPALEHLLNRAWSKKQPKTGQAVNDWAASLTDGYMQSNGAASLESRDTSKPTDPRIWDAARVCIEAAKRSTTVFDDIPPPLILTNIYGTAQAQFGNVLVLMAVYQSKTSLADLIDRRTMSALLDRTIRFLRDYKGCCPGMGKDIDLLEKIKSRYFYSGEDYIMRGTRV